MHLLSYMPYYCRKIQYIIIIWVLVSETPNSLLADVVIRLAFNIHNCSLIGEMFA